jgi:hypothetical protein
LLPVSFSNSALSAATIDFTAPALMIFISPTMNFSLIPGRIVAERRGFV